MGKAVRLLASVATAVLFAGVVVLVTVIGSVRSAAVAAERPNIVFVLTDDLDSHDMRYLDGLRSIMASNGTTFTRAYVSDAVC
jgi:N-acetylglucosamine-6-sulfatase